MHVYKMNSCHVGKVLRKLLLIAAGLLILYGLVSWDFLPTGNLWHRAEGNGSASEPEDVERLIVCPPVQKDMTSAGGMVNSAELNVIQQGNPCFRCSDGRSAEDGRWFNFSTHSIRILIYSATFDDRSGLASTSVIRLIGVADLVSTWPLRCLLHHDGGIRQTPVQPEPMVIGGGWGLDGTNIQEYIFTCSATSGVPYAVSIVEEDNEEHPHQSKDLKKQFIKKLMGENWVGVKREPVMKPNNRTVSSCVPVQVPSRPTKRDDFAICVPVAYRSIDPYRLIEWLELQRLLGVSRVGVAHIGLNKNSLAVLEHYRREGFLDLRRTDRLTLKPDGDHRRLHSTPTINDCVLRNMHQFNWILVLDFDEFILPRRHSTLRELVQYLDGKGMTGGRLPATGYVFRNNYFFLDLQPDDSISPYLAVLRYRSKVPVSERGYSVKSMINPRACSRMHNHVCWGRVEAYSKYAGDVEVDVEDGLNQHYKRCHFSPEKCRLMMQNVTLDNGMLRFEEQLTSRVRLKVKEIMGHDL